MAPNIPLSRYYLNLPSMNNGQRSNRSSVRLSIPTAPDGLYTFFSTNSSTESLSFRAVAHAEPPPVPIIPAHFLPLRDGNDRFPPPTGPTSTPIPQHSPLHPINSSLALPPPPTATMPLPPNPSITFLLPPKPTPPPPPPTTSTQRTPLHLRLIVLALSLSSFFAALDTVILATALPSISSSLSLSNANYAWIPSSFLLACSASMPLFARLSDVFGRKPVLLAANTTFFIGSVIGGAAKGLGTLLAGRVIQGIGAGGLLVLPNVVISDLFSQRERGFYLSVIGMTWAVASALGAVVGGFFAEKVSWRWCFFVNLPFEAVSIALVLAYLDVHRPSTRWVQGVKAIDWLGAAVLAGATVMLLLGLEFGGVTYPWTSGVVIGLIVGGTLGFAAFVGVEVKVANRPLLPVRVFAHRSPAAILGVVFTHGTCYIAAAYFLPLYFQLVLGASPLLAGAWFLVTAATLAITTIVSGKYMQRTGRYLEVVYFGTMMMALGFTLLTNFPPNRSWLRIVMYQIVVALGIGPLFQSPLIALQTNLAPADIAAGSAAYSSIRQLACGISVVVGQVLFQAKMKDHLENLAKAGISGDLARSLANGDLISTAFSVRSLPADQRDVVRAATSDSLARMWIFYAVVGLLGLVFSFGIKKKMLMRDHVEHMTGLDELSGNEDDVSAVVVKGEGKGGIV